MILSVTISVCGGVAQHMLIIFDEQKNFLGCVGLCRDLESLFLISDCCGVT